MQIIPWINAPNWVQNIILDNIPYNMEVTYNNRDDGWYISISDNAGNYIISGKKLNLNIDLLYNVDTNIISGILLVVPMNENIITIDKNNMGESVKLIYISKDEVL